MSRLNRRPLTEHLTAERAGDQENGQSRYLGLFEFAVVLILKHAQANPTEQSLVFAEPLVVSDRSPQ